MRYFNPPEVDKSARRTADKYRKSGNNQLKEWVCKPSSVPAGYGRRRSFVLTNCCQLALPHLLRDSNVNFSIGAYSCSQVLFAKSALTPRSRCGKRPTRWQSGKLNRSRSGRATSFLVFQAVGFALPAPSPAPRCALTAPFHHCPRRCLATARRGGCVFSVALSLGLPPVAVSHHRALSCPDFPPPLIHFVNQNDGGDRPTHSRN